MRENKKTVTFDFAFKYSRDGIWDQGNSITVCEPGFANRQVFRKMQSYVARSRAIGAANANRNLTPEQFEAQTRAVLEFRAAQAAAKETASTDATVVAPPAIAVPDITMDWFSDFPPDEFMRFSDDVLKALTGNKALAYIGDDHTLMLSNPGRLAVGEGVWASIADEGGMDAIDKVLMAFASFFIYTQPATNSSVTTSGAT
jgi:hypothetical protein